MFVLGDVVTLKITSAESDNAYFLTEIASLPGGGPAFLHTHVPMETFWILEGEMTFYVGDQTIKAHPGSFLFGPKGVPHAFTVDSGPARLLFVLSPAGFEDLVRDMGEPARALTMPPQPEVFAGRDSAMKAWEEGGFGTPQFGELRCVITRTNRMPAVACYLRKPGEAEFRPLALDVLRYEGGRA